MDSRPPTVSAAMPLSDYFWLTKGMRVVEGYWIIVYTGPGQQKATKLETGEPCLVLHWGKDKVIFTLPIIVPVLLRVGGVTVGSHIPPARPSLTGPERRDDAEQDSDGL